MRIAYVTADRGIPVFGNKGASVHVRAIVQAFADLGHDVTVFAARRAPPNTKLDASIVKVIPPGDSDWLRPASASTTKTEARERYSLAVSAEIEDTIVAEHKRSPFDFIYERYALFSTAGIRAARRAGIPCMMEVNSPLVLEQSRYRDLHHVDEARSVEREVFSSADALFAVSEPLRQYVVDHGGHAERVAVLPNAVDDRHFGPSVKPVVLSEMRDKYVIGFVGSLKPWHGIATLMEAFRRYAQDDRTAHLLVIGEGTLADWLAGFVAGSGLEKSVTQTGWLRHDQLPAWLCAMDVAVAPYPEIEDFYFSPLKLYEYLACGVPVVASRIGQIQTQLRHNEEALLTTPGDSRELCDAFGKLRQQPALRKRLRYNGLRAVSGMTWTNNARSVLQALRKQAAVT